MTAELERQLANLIRIGRVKSVQYDPPAVKLSIGDLETDWLPWSTSRAGGTRSWTAPTVGEQRMLFSPYGDMGQAVIGPAIYQDDYPAPATSGDQEHVVFPDGSSVDYNSATNTLTVSVAGSGKVIVNCKQADINATDAANVNTKTATVTASTKVDLLTPITHCSGSLTVDGTITGLSGLAISGTVSGGSASAAINGPVTINGDTTTTGALTNNGKAVGSTLRVSGVQSGGSISGNPV